ncbi:MAG: PAS domain S-box protein [Candidatus Cloacimonetes bacterium]|nr:PAS domain S-box protein [Candidatus Cloacimonadota bacterium]
MSEKNRTGQWIVGLLAAILFAGALIIILGIDIDAGNRKCEITTDAILPIGLMLALLTILGASLLAFRTQSEASSQSVLRRLLIPLALSLMLLVGGFSLVLFNVQQEHLNHINRDKLDQAVGGITQLLIEQSKALEALTDVFLHDEGLRDALKRQDRQALLAAREDTFAHLRDDFNITHFHFHGPDRVNLLRMHMPDKSGDLIDRFTAREAERTGRTASGIELGMLGTFTLRIVQPVFDGDTLIGYMEIGKEIEDILASIHKNSEIELAVVIHKNALDRNNWEAGMEMLGRDADWDRFPDDALIYTSMPDFPSALESFINEDDHLRHAVTAKVEWDGRTLQLAVAELIDVSGADVGNLIVLHDISESEMALKRLIAVTAGAALVLLAGLFGFLYTVLRRVDQGIIERESDLARSEKFQRTLTETSPDYIFVLDGDGVIQKVNRLPFGWHEKDMVGKKAFTFMQPKYHEAFEEAFRQAIDTGQLQTLETKIELPDGLCYLFNRLNPLPLIGEEYAIMLISTDITERKNLEHQLMNAQMLESIGQLAAGIAHEINTPVQFVSDNVSFLAESFADLVQVLDAYKKLVLQLPTDNGFAGEVENIAKMWEELDLDFLLDEVPEALTQSDEGLQKIAQIVRAMKEFSHPGVGEKKPTNINHAIETIVIVARNEWKYVAEVEVDFDTDLPPVHCLPDEFNQVILNMIINAAHAIGNVVKDNGMKGVIRLGTRLDGDHAVITIADNGSGMPKDILARIFDPFFTTKEVGKGTGQGLAISHAVIVEKHGGKIDVESTPGKGTTFTLRIPVNPPKKKTEVQHG